MKILIIEDDSDIRDILMFTFDSEVSATYLHANCGKEGIDVINMTDDIDLIVCDYNMPNGNGGTVYQYLLDNNINIPYVMCSSDLAEDHEEFENKKVFLCQIVKPHLYEGVQKTLHLFEKLSDNEDVEVERNETNYTFISIDLLKIAKIIPCSVFKAEDETHVRVFKQGDYFTEEDYRKYDEIGMDSLIIEKQYVENFIDIIGSTIQEIIDCKTEKSEKKVLDIHAVIMDTISSLGISAQVIRATEQSIAFTKDVFKKNKEFKEIYKNIFGHEGTYLTKHSIALAYISCGLLAKSNWDSFENRNKLVLASFFHDASIKITDFNDEYKIECESVDQKTFQAHPPQASKLLTKLKGVPQDLDKIVLDHHERPDGSGFPRGLTANQIQPLSALFIFSHDLVDIIFKLEKAGEDLSQELLLSKVDKELYDSGPFKKCVEALEKTVLIG